MTIFTSNRKFPNPITVTDDPKSHTLALQQVIEALNIGQRRTREINSSYVRVHELVDVGLIEVVGNRLKLTNLGQSVAAAPGASALADLTDVDLTGLADGDVLIWNSATSMWEPGTVGGGAITGADMYDVSLNDLADVAFPPPVAGDLLVFDGTTWTNAPAGAAGGGALVFLQEKVASSSATLDFTSFISDDYESYIFECIGIVASNSLTDFFWRFSTGGAFDSGSNYVNNHYLQATTGNVSVTATGSTEFRVRNNAEIDNTATRGLSGKIELFHPKSTTLWKRIGGNIRWSGSTPNYINSILDGVWKNTAVVDGVQFLFSAGNIASGTIRVYGVKKAASSASSGGVAAAFSGASIKLTANDSYSSGADRRVDWDSAEWDTHGYWSSGSPSRFTIPVGGAGKYQLTANISPTGAMDYAVILYKNGVSVSAAYVSGTYAQYANVWVQSAVAGDYFEIFVNTNTNPLTVDYTKCAATITRLAGVGLDPVNAAMSPPRSADFTWVNQGTASLTDKDGRLVFQQPGNASLQLRGFVKTAPSPPYTVTAAVAVARGYTGANYHGIGIIVRESSSGKIKTCDHTNENNAGSYRCLTWTNATTFSSVTAEWKTGVIYGLLWFRVTDDGTTRKSYFSFDGKDWNEFLSEARATGFTTAPDQVGIAGYLASTTVVPSPKASILHFSIANSVLGDEP